MRCFIDFDRGAFRAIVRRDGCILAARLRVRCFVLFTTDAGEFVDACGKTA